MNKFELGIKQTNEGEIITPSPEIVERAISNGNEPPDYTPYMPGSELESELFSNHWCEECKHVNHCTINLDMSLDQQRSEWIYFADKPICTKWEGIDG